jgi:hypothetical protein
MEGCQGQLSPLEVTDSEESSSLHGWDFTAGDSGPAVVHGPADWAASCSDCLPRPELVGIVEDVA